MTASNDRDEVMRDSVQHIRRVGHLLIHCANILSKRAIDHDASKFDPEEWESFVHATPFLKKCEYGSPEYKAKAEEIRGAIERHYMVNQHHPEFWENGINDMTLLDLVEMLCDWKGASERQKDGNLHESLIKNRPRFKIEEQLYEILYNTAYSLGWLNDRRGSNSES